MNRIPMLLGAVLLVVTDAVPLQAQKPMRASPTLAGTPSAAAAPAAPPAAAQPATKRARATPTLGSPPAATAQPATAPATTATPSTAPAAAPGVQPQAAGSEAPAAAAPGAATAGLAIEPFNEEAGELAEYTLRFVQQLDSAIVTLVAVFRNTSGQPLAGAAAPTALSQRERDRWGRCRDLHWDLQSYATAMHDLLTNFEDSPAVHRAAAALDTSLSALQATGECDNVASMIAAPDRWTPWGQQYQAGARRFYTGWYPQARDVQEKNRAFILALNGTREAEERILVPPAMPRNPPYAGASVR